MVQGVVIHPSCHLNPSCAQRVSRKGGASDNIVVTFPSELCQGAIRAPLRGSVKSVNPQLLSHIAFLVSTVHSPMTHLLEGRFWLLSPRVLEPHFGRFTPQGPFS